MATGVRKYSTTAASNASSDSNQNWAEGMAPSAVNDSARAGMASIAKWRDDLNGTITTAGTSTAYTIASNQNWSGDAYAAGDEIGFCVDETNGATVTINIDSLGAKPLRSAPGVELTAGQLEVGVPYRATYFTSNSGEWILHGGLIQDESVTYAKIQDVSDDGRILGRATSGAGPVEEITLGTGLVLDGSTLNALTGASGLVSGLVIQNNSSTPNTNVDVTANQAVMVDSDGVPIFASGISVTVNCTTTGANGLDTGSLANNTFYHFWLISNGTTTAGLTSTSSSSPTLPSGYTYKVRIGAKKTDGSANFYRTIQQGNVCQYKVVTGSNTTSMRSIGLGPLGSNSGSGTITWSAQTIRGASGASPIWVPPTAVAVHMNAQNGYNGSSITVIDVAPNANYGNLLSDNPAPITADTSARLSLQFWLELEADTVQVAAASSGGAFWILGYRDSVSAS